MGAYTGDNYHISATFTTQNDGFINGSQYFLSKTLTAQTDVDTDGWALRAWWRPDEEGTAVPSISVGYDTASFNTTSGYKNGEGYSIALNWSDMFQVDDTIGIALGAPIKGSDHTDGSTKDGDPFIWEAYYSFKPNDSIEITPGIFGGSDVHSTRTNDEIFGAVLATTFRF